MRNFKVYIDGTEYEVAVEEVGAESAPVAEVKPATSAPAKKVAITGGTPIKAPMPGMIKELKCAEGATVKKGDVIIVLEAMKMDNDITAEADGKISYKVTKGANVETDAIMAVIG
jgi:biotin carboxyl carrier protein